MPANWILLTEQQARKGLVHDRDRQRSCPVTIIDISAGEQRRACRPQVTWRNVVNHRHSSIGGLGNWLLRAPDEFAIAAIEAKRQSIDDSDRLDSRQRPGFCQQIAIELAHSLLVV